MQINGFRPVQPGLLGLEENIYGPKKFAVSCKKIDLGLFLLISCEGYEFSKISMQGDYLKRKK